MNIYAGDIGPDEREYETFPLTEPVREPAEPVKVPEEVPA